MSSQEPIPAGFWRRWAARALDQILLLLCLLALWIVARMALAEPGYMRSETERLIQFIVQTGYFVIAALYFAATESAPQQATLGKRAVGIKVTDVEGRRIGFTQALGRWFATGLSWATLCLGFLPAAFGRKRALHDYFSHTQVVDQWAYSDTPERQQHGPSFAMQVVGVLALAFALGFPIAWSQYADYVVRSQVSEASSLADGLKQSMATYVLEHGVWPDSLAEIGEPETLGGEYVGKVVVGKRTGRIELAFSSKPPQRAHPALDGRHLFFHGRVENGEVRWSCHSEELRQSDCPSACQCSW